MDKDTVLTVLKAAPLSMPVYIYLEKSPYTVGSLIVNIQDGIWATVHECVKVIEVHEDRVVLR